MSTALQAATVPRFAYAINAFDSSVSSYIVDEKTGALRHNGFAFTGKFPSHIVTHPNGRFIYAVAQTGMTISSYRVDSITGQLTELGESPQRMGIVSPARIAMDPKGEFLYVAGRNSGDIAGFRINPETGSITAVPGSPFPGKGKTPRSISMHPSGRFVYHINTVTDNVMAYAINRVDGSLNEVPGAPFAVGRAPQFMVFTPDGRFAFLTNWMTHVVQRFAVDTVSGVLQYLSEVRTGLYPFDLTVDASGRHLYVGSWGDNNVWVYALDPQQGSLEPITGSPYANAPATGPTVSVSLTPDQKYLYVTNYDSNDITQFKVGSDGGLKLAGRVTARMGPRNMAMVGGAEPVKYLAPQAYVLDVDHQQLVRLQVDAESGRLSLSAREAAGEAPVGLALGARGESLFILDGKRQSVARYAINGAEGDLKLVSQEPPIKSGKAPADIAIDTNSRFLYVTNAADNSLSIYWIDKAQLVEVPRTRLFDSSPYATGPAPGEIKIHPSGRYAYVLNAGTGTLSTFGFYEDGPLNIPNDPNKATYAVGEAVKHMAVSPSGNYLLTLSPKLGQATVWRIHPRSGEFEPMSFARQTIGGKPVAVSISADERFVSILDAAKGRVQPYTLDVSTGKLTKIGTGLDAGRQPHELQLDASGRFLYAVSASGVIMTYRVNHETGDLAIVDKLKLGGELVDFSLRTLTH